jgi:hypothetical protein
LLPLMQRHEAWRHLGRLQTNRPVNQVGKPFMFFPEIKASFHDQVQE